MPKRLKGLRERAPFQNRLRKLRKRAGGKAEGSSNLQVSPPLHQAGVTSEQVSPSNIPMKHSFVLIKAPFLIPFSRFLKLPTMEKTRDSVKSLNSGFTNNKCQKCHEFRGTYIDYHRFLAIPFCHATNCNSSPGRSQCAWLFDSDWLNDWKLMVSHIFSVGILEQKMRKIEE